MFDTTNLAIASLVAHPHINPEAQRELQLTISHALNNAPAGLTIAQKQLALIVMLEELAKSYPADYQAQNSLAVTSTILLGSRLLTAVSMGYSADQ
jgi:hypothetical protein